MTFIRNIFRVTLMVLFGITVALYLTMQGEDDYQRNCERLHVKCESSGFLQTFWKKIDLSKLWLEESWHKLRGD